MSAGEGLKPCPFCGGSNLIVHDIGEERVLCLDCSGDAPPDKWNTRATDKRVEELEAEIRELRGRLEKRGNMLEDVVNALDLSSAAVEEHGPLGTPPAELVRLVLEQKYREIRNLRSGMQPLPAPPEEG